MQVCQITKRCPKLRLVIQAEDLSPQRAQEFARLSAPGVRVVSFAEVLEAVRFVSTHQCPREPHSRDLCTRGEPSPLRTSLRCATTSGPSSTVRFWRLSWLTPAAYASAASGTTGVPKGVIILHSNIASAVAGTASRTVLTPSDIHISYGRRLLTAARPRSLRGSSSAISPWPTCMSG